MDANNYVMLNPSDIERRSFEIITDELGHLQLPMGYDAIIKRIVHTTADFDYARITDIHPNAIAAALLALQSGCRIYTDTRMIIAGVSKPSLRDNHCEAYTYVDDEEVVAMSKVKGITRSILGIEKAIADPATQIFVIGNAPTALVRLGELILENKVNPALVIGVPVGFVGAAESKAFIKTAHVPYIVTDGRKGGSTVAVAILNALLYMGRV